MANTSMTVNGQACLVQADPDGWLIDLLRDELGLPGTRFGCGAGDCGACLVLVDGRAQTACNLPVWAAADRAVTTVEGLGNLGGAAAALGDAFIAEQAAQCAYCSSGMLVAAAALLRATPRPSEAQVRAALDGQLCRCGAHNRIVRAVLRAANAAEAAGLAGGSDAADTLSATSAAPKP